MDLLTAINLASNIIVSIDFGMIVFKNTKEIYDFVSGSTEGNLSYEFIAKEMEAFSQKLLPPDD